MFVIIACSCTRRLRLRWRRQQQQRRVYYWSNCAYHQIIAISASTLGNGSRFYGGEHFSNRTHSEFLNKQKILQHSVFLAPFLSKNPKTLSIRKLPTSSHFTCTFLLFTTNKFVCKCFMNTKPVFWTVLLISQQKNYKNFSHCFFSPVQPTGCTRDWNEVIIVYKHYILGDKSIWAYLIVAISNSALQYERVWFFFNSMRCQGFCIIV